MMLSSREEHADPISLAGDDFVEEGDADLVEEPRPEDSIPDLPENQAARDFLRTAPSKGLHMPLGKEVKVMQCWRCKAYGHRTGDRECPLHLVGNTNLDVQRRSREDPMSLFVSEKDKEQEEKWARVQQLHRLVEEIRVEERDRKRRREEKKVAKKEKKRAKKEKKKEKRHSSGDHAKSERKKHDK